MANNFGSVILLIIFTCTGSVVTARNVQLISSASTDNDGICKSMVESHGYACEEHRVKTQDGYILSMQRIPMGRADKTPADRTPVLVQHGVLMDAITWLLESPEQSLGYILADNGFDVWLANSRGTKFSRQHTSLTSHDSAYWDWTWDELVSKDLPATFEYVHEKTGKKLHYVGHSLGTLIAFAAFSQGKLLDMLRSAALLSPVAYVDKITSPLARTVVKLSFAESLNSIGVHEFDPRGAAVSKLLGTICKDPATDCFNLMTSFTGKNCCLNSSTVQVFLEHEPQPTSTKNLIHLSQMFRKGTITMYDYGHDDQNKKHYGQADPPEYDMTRIPKDVPLFLSHGGMDALSDVKDVKRLLDDLKDHDRDKLEVHYRADYAHADLVMAVNANQVVYDPLMAFFRRF